MFATLRACEVSAELGGPRVTRAAMQRQWSAGALAERPLHHEWMAADRWQKTHNFYTTATQRSSGRARDFNFLLLQINAEVSIVRLLVPLLFLLLFYVPR